MFRGIYIRSYYFAHVISLDIMEVAHALSMLPGIFYSVYSMYKISSPSFFQQATSISYIFCCLCSMHFHMYKHFKPQWKLHDKLHKQALLLDMLSQNVFTFFLSVHSRASLYGSLYIFLASFLDYYLVKNHIEHIYIRHIYASLLSTIIASSNSSALWYWICGMTSFVLSKTVDYSWHSVFHIFLHLAYYTLNQNNPYTLHSPLLVPTAYANILVPFYAILLSTVIGNMYNKTWLYLDKIVISSIYALYNSYCMFNAFDLTKIFSDEYTTCQITQSGMESAYYVAYSLVEIYNGDITMTGHHLLALGLIFGTSYYKFYQFETIFLFLFTISNVPLACAKAARHLRRNANIPFAIFALMFFIFRICFVPFILKYTIIDGYINTSLPAYIGMNALLISLYVMQWFWFAKILRIITKKSE